ncbi:MAG: hypothetical protein EOP31_26575 [Rhodococcus sp. (in: high G+C Gram-positive bacteria)]|uniref:hypothetical protein n=1 Tax=Rhodococcus sp. TaxID=1831 RepID=UPI0012156593|nr:hypothetical protein [Rhodococcus sp. (in: high G+C Gram-positive bacteria)]RZL21848.1 MAG: hypothetical protein EOP31_26575 [Rhodococcus sp. (in: high G+C Gram-positive bacteria)]
MFGLNRGRAPDESTLRKLFARVDALDHALGLWMWTRTFVADHRRVIALDGIRHTPRCTHRQCRDYGGDAGNRSNTGQT